MGFVDLLEHPHNAWSLLGLQQSLLAQHKLEQAAGLAAAVELAWKEADVKPIASCYCHPQARLTTVNSSKPDPN